MQNEHRDIQILRGLVEQYLEACSDPRFAQNKELWRRHNSLKPTRPLIFVQNFGFWEKWCGGVWNEKTLLCKDPFYRAHEAELRIELYEQEFGDDRVCVPWITQSAIHAVPPGKVWGMSREIRVPDTDQGAFKEINPFQDWKDLNRLTVPHHRIDESATTATVAKISDAVGDLIDIDLDRGPVLRTHAGSIAEPLCALRGIETVMLDMYEHPEELHKLLSFLRDATLANQGEAERAGDWGSAGQCNQAELYCEELDDPQPNDRGKKRSELFGYSQAQELTLVSPEMHDEFMIQYQLPIMEKFGLIAYGCCEDVTRKIDLLRKIPNLRQIAVAPVADVQKCAEQIGPDYTISWRPNPAEMVCCGFDEARIQRTVGEALRMFKANDCRVHINLKDVQTLEGDLERPKKWVAVVRRLIDQIW